MYRVPYYFPSPPLSTAFLTHKSQPAFFTAALRPEVQTLFTEFGMYSGFGAFRIGGIGGGFVLIYPRLAQHRPLQALPLSTTHTSPSAMSSEVDPSTLSLTSHDLTKISKKDLVKHLSVLQGMYTERGRKYGM
jgi:hypothetical protein